jgi:1,4-alpha-glucan branching enzyme
MPKSPAAKPPAPETAQNPSQLDEAALQALLQARHGDPFSVLGMHQVGDALVVRVLLPGAFGVAVVDVRDRKVADLQRQPGTPLFTAVMPRRRNPFAYRLRITWEGAAGEPAHTLVLEDAYRFEPQITQMDVWLLAEGTHQRPYEWLGAHLNAVDGVAGTRFAVWAPSARRVSVVGDFNQWDGRRHMMRLRHECGVWEIFVPHVGEGDLYKFELLGADGQVEVKSDPFAFRAELRPQTASVVQRLLPGLAGSEERRRANALDAPDQRLRGAPGLLAAR